MRVLILSVSAGYGHHAAAMALADELGARGVQAAIADLYQYVSRIQHDIIENGYLFSVKHLKKPYHHAYNTLESREGIRRVVSLLTANRFIARRFARYFDEFTPDVIVATHVFAAQVLDVLRGYGFLTVPVVGIVTDYCLHPFWEDVEHIDAIVLPSELMVYAAQRRGIPAEKLLPLGLPVRAAFSVRRSQAEAREKLGLAPDRNTVLVMGGSMGYGSMLTTVSSILDLGMELQAVCICGSNDRLRRRLEHLSHRQNLHILGFVNNVDEYMDAADCILTKPGGITVTEALCKALPMVLTDPIPGHEERNVDFLVRNGAAVHTDAEYPPAEAVYHLFSSPERLEMHRRAAALLSKPDAAARICDLILDF